MEEIRKERLMISITTLAALSCIMQSYLGEWEFWAPWLILAGLAALWWLHVTARLDHRSRIILCFVYAAFVLFYYGVHDTGLFDVSVMTVLFMAVFTLADRIWLLDLILAEYAAVMVIEFWLVYGKEEAKPDGFTVMRIAFHIVTVLTMYLFSRSAVNNRISENNRIRKWQDSVDANDRDMEDFLTNVSHELGTPVNVISGMTSILKKKHDDEELDHIRGAALRLGQQIGDIRDYTEIKRGEVVLENENYMSVSLINDAVSACSVSKKDSHLELIIDLDPDMPSVLTGDFGKLRRIFRHLLDNSVKFTQTGGIYVKVYGQPREYGINLIIEITDTGIGMTRNDMSRVTGGMYQADKNRNRKTGGIGIGLPIVYGFVHSMGGFVTISSENRRGTTVRLSIPQAVTDPSPCLPVNKDAQGGIVFYMRTDMHRIPQVREFYRSMEISLSGKIKTGLYSAGEKKELESLLREQKISYIFMGQEEYAADADSFEDLAAEGYTVAVAAGPDLKIPHESRVLVIPKPLYAFPVIKIINGEQYTHNKNASEEKPLFKGVKALIVDDEPMNLVVAEGFVKGYGMDVDIAESGTEAIRMYEEGQYDLILMDHMMPVMDGVEAMKRIRKSASQNGAEPVIVALTANASSGARKMFSDEGFDGFVAKPIDAADFELVMQSVLPKELKNIGEGGGR